MKELKNINVVVRWGKMGVNMSGKNPHKRS